MQLDFQQWLIVVLFVSLFFKDEAKGFIRNKLGLTTAGPEKLQEGMDYLKLHFNDDLTTILTELQVGQTQGFSSVKDKQDNLKDEVKRANYTLDSFDKYGVPIRK